MPQVLSEGSVLSGRYVIEARLGDGAMGTVYRARHVKMGRHFAIKILHKTLVSNAKVLKRFEREAELAGRLRHTNVASVVDVGVTDDGQHFTAMEFASGDTLCGVLDDGPVSETRVLDLAKQLCSGLQHAHDLGLIHRDFKPENVIVESVAGGREVPRIVDWGVAILLEDAGDVEREDRLTTKGIVVGTPHYMAPEQARGGGIDHRVDLFALGLICYELLTGKLPFEGSGVDVARANLQQPTPPMSERAPGVHVDPVFEAIVRKLLEKDPNERPPSGDAARELFELYERDRAGCALLLGVEIAVEDRRTGAIEELDDSEVADEPADVLPAPARGTLGPRRARAGALAAIGWPWARAHSPSQNEHGARDPERGRETDELTPPPSRRLAAVAAFFAVALAFVLWLGLRGHKAAVAPVIALDAREELAVAETKRDEPVLVDVPTRTLTDAQPPSQELFATPKPTTKKPPPATGSGSSAPASHEAPSASEVAKLYGVVGRELKALDAKKGMDATIELWPRYRWIRINEWIATPERRAQIAQELERLRADIKKSL